jgi:hypothetical protein
MRDRIIETIEMTVKEANRLIANINERINRLLEHEGWQECLTR